MRDNTLRGKRKRRFQTTTQSDHRDPIAPNVFAREFTVEQPNTASVSAITYIWTLEGWLYLAVILDRYSRRVVGWAMGNRIDKALTLGALRVALETRWSAAPHRPWQSVCGERLCTLLNARGINCSMSRKENCWDNAVAESFFTTSKVEFVDGAMFHAPAQATRDIFEYIEVLYNRVGRLSSSSDVSPLAFEKDYVPRHLAA